MLRGLYTATSAMTTNNKKLDVVTNNIANINTTGYKKDLVVSETFPEVLIKKIAGSNDMMDTDFFKGVEVVQNGNTYEMKTEGGFFRTKTPLGISYEKAVNFAVNEEGYLSTYYRDQDGNIDTSAGYQVLGNRGPILVGNGQLEVNDRGQVMVNGNIVDNLVMITPPGIIGTLNSGVRLDKIETNHEQGQVYETDNKMDLAIKGRGFFQVETPEGVRYTRDGSFKLNTAGELVTDEGYRVLGIEGPIVIEGAELAVSERGNILVDGEYIDQLNMIEIVNLRDLRKDGDNLYRLEDGMELESQPFRGEILQGFLEGSNVDSVKEMVEMITLFRNYESNQRMIKAYDDTLQKTVNDIGKV
ncbi:flagellar basal-body rod protein FlgG [Anaerosolibacter carboniphilus]|uniref:Flagellar basal-body rod protein FlgG n=1 Tax=Anaerosolibacter carboniphilus TaxID=1417629 RepID=A0A841L1U5_9FIRM|nr:flagellar hook-basal body protein [Anaerosolibacter carboniphilus]MBB6216359.1 flagellar basal-body rod protein FlgG [Anaerosolibacter carboniphilus]